MPIDLGEIRVKPCPHCLSDMEEVYVEDGKWVSLGNHDYPKCAQTLRNRAELAEAQYLQAQEEIRKLKGGFTIVRSGEAGTTSTC